MTNIYFSDIFHLHPQFLKMLHSHKGEISVLLLMKVTSESYKGQWLVAQKDQPYDYTVGTFSPINTSHPRPLP